MKRVTKLAPFALGLFIVGCGGSGGGSSESAHPKASALTFVEAILAPGGVAPADPSDWVVQDPQNITVTQNVQFQLVSYDGSGKRTVLPATGWDSSDADNVYGSLSADNGLFQAKTLTTPTPEFAGVRYDGVQYYTAYSVKPTQAILIGQIVDPAGNPVRGVYIEFYNGSGVLVGKVAQPYSGSFRASVPLNTATFQVVADTTPVGFQRYFSYDGKGYQSSNEDCRASLGTALSTGNNTLANPIVIAPTSAPEPDLTGCG